MGRKGTISIHDTCISVWEETVNEPEMHDVVYSGVIKLLRKRGFSIHTDAHIKKHYRLIAKNHHTGKKHLLEVHVSLCGRHLEIQFYQNVNFENRNGGRYDFDKYQKMPYLVQKRFVLEASALLQHLYENHGYSFWGNLEGFSCSHVFEALRGTCPCSQPLKRFNEMWGDGRFRRDETGWPEVSEYDYGGNKDREGVQLRNGMYRWIRDRKGYLKRGQIFTNMNQMWQIIYGPGRRDTTWVHCRELFSLQPDDCRGRHFSDENRKARIEKELAKAVKEMNFERAAKLRDLIQGKSFETIRLAA